jgi:putative MATE family efflux protein
LRDLTKGSIFSNLWHLALPLMAANMIQTLFNLVDMAFVGRLGPPAIAAVSVVGVVMMLPFALILGLGVASGAMISRYVGANDHSRANHVAIQSALAAIGGALIVTVIGITSSHFILRIFGVTGNVQELGAIYIRILFIGTIPFSLQFLLAAIFQAVGDGHSALWINLSAIMINIVLDPLLIYGLAFFPRLEVAGAALATTLSRTIGMALGLYLFFTRYQSRLGKPKLDFRPDKSLLKAIAKLGFPSSLQTLLRSMSGMVFMGLVAQYGTVALAAYGIGIRLDLLIMMPGFGLAAATATLVGQNLGAEKPHRAEKSSWSAAIGFVLIMSAVGLVFYLIPRELYSLFNSSSAVLDQGSSYLRTIVWGYPFLALSIIFTRALTGAGDTFKPMMITGMSLFLVAVPLAMAIPKLFNTGIRGVWLAIVISHSVNGLCMMAMFIKGGWKSIRI